MTFLHFAKAVVRIGPFVSCVAQTPYSPLLAFWQTYHIEPPLVVVTTLTSSMHFLTFSALNDFTMKKRVSVSNIVSIQFECISFNSISFDSTEASLVNTRRAARKPTPSLVGHKRKHTVRLAFCFVRPTASITTQYNTSLVRDHQDSSEP
jgi:hypothetical protein